MKAWEAMSPEQRAERKAKAEARHLLRYSVAIIVIYAALFFLVLNRYLDGFALWACWAVAVAGFGIAIVKLRSAAGRFVRVVFFASIFSLVLFVFGYFTILSIFDSIAEDKRPLVVVASALGFAIAAGLEWLGRLSPSGRW